MVTKGVSLAKFLKYETAEGSGKGKHKGSVVLLLDGSLTGIVAQMLL